MPSPFPGMDPYIEDPEIWGDFHSDLPAEIRAVLNPLIRPRYVARLIPRVTYEVVEVAQTRINLEFPLRLQSIEILATETMELVTAIEILSPVNKRPGHDAYRHYLRKRQELLRSSAHLLEIDLLRGGTRPPLAEPVPPAPYYITLSRANHRPGVAVWPIQLQDPLPVLPVPLLEPDPDVPLDLKEIVAAVYERGGYADLIDYSQSPPPPPLSVEEAEWVHALLSG